MTLMDKLLPCPFCGGKTGLGLVGRDWYRLEVSHDTDCIIFDHQLDYSQTSQGLKDLFEQWNTRYEPLTDREKMLDPFERNPIVPTESTSFLNNGNDQ